MQYLLIILAKFGRYDLNARQIVTTTFNGELITIP